MNIDDISAVGNSGSVSEISAESQAQNPETNALEEFMADTEPTEDAQESAEEAVETTEQTEPTSEEVVPKGIKGRIAHAEAKADKRGYERGKQEAYAEWEKQKAEYERQLAEYTELKLDREAAETAKRYGVNKEFALRLLRAERGLAPTPKAPEVANAQPKTEQKNVLSDERRTTLNRQAAQIRDKYNLDVLSRLTEDDAKAIFNGSMDLWEVAMREMAQPAPKSAPKPVRNGGASSSSAGGLDFSTMSDEEFDRFNEKIARGAVFKPR